LVDALVVPVGGGGMLAGIAVTVKVRNSFWRTPHFRHRSLFCITVHCEYLLSIPPKLPFLLIIPLALGMEGSALHHCPLLNENLTAQEPLQ